MKYTQFWNYFWIDISFKLSIVMALMLIQGVEILLKTCNFIYMDYYIGTHYWFYNNNLVITQ